MDDDELAAELDNMEDDDVAAARIYCEQMQINFNETKAKALAEKSAGNNQKAIEHMKKMKEYQKILEEQYAKFPSLAPKV